MKIHSKYPLIIILLLYIIANFFMFFNNGRFWDDWCLISPEGIRDISTGVGAPFMISIHTWLFNLTTKPALLYHILTGVIEILGIVTFYKSLLLLKVAPSHTFLLTLFFALLPYNKAKMAMSCFAYSIGLLFLLLSVLLFIYFIHKNSLIARIISLSLFFCSFLFLPSTLVLALAFFLFMAIFCQKHEVEFKLSYLKIILNKLFTWLDFILIPFVFWIFRLFFLNPSGIYAAEGYREFKFKTVLSTPVNLILTFIQNFVGLGSACDPLSTYRRYAILFIIFIIILIPLLRKYKKKSLHYDKRVLYLGLFFFFAGSLAYIMVGLSPSFNGFNSRHQILLKFGTSFLLFYLISLIYSAKAQRVIIAIIISLFMIVTIRDQLLFQNSWFKQIALERAFSQEKLLSEGVNFVIIDNTREYNEINAYPFYVYTGILKKTFGTQTRFAIDSKMLKGFVKYDSLDFINNSFYNMKDCKNITSFNYWVIINPGSVSLSKIQSFKMLYQYYFDRVKFDSTLNKILSLKVFPYYGENK